MIGADDVCGAVTRTVEAHLPQALDAVHARGGLDLEVPKAVDMPTDEALLTGAGLVTPSFVVSSPGLAGAPTRSGDGSYNATWRVIVTFFCRGEGYGDTATRARQYAKAGRAAVMRHQQLDGLASAVDWVGEEYDRINARDARTLAGAFVTFDIDIDGALDDTSADVPVDAIELTTSLLPVPVFGEDTP